MLLGQTEMANVWITVVQISVLLCSSDVWDWWQDKNCLFVFCYLLCLFAQSQINQIYLPQSIQTMLSLRVCWCPRGESVGLHWLILSGKDYIRDYLEPSNMGQWHSCVKHTKTQETYPYWLQQNIFSKVKFLQFWIQCSGRLYVGVWVF